MILTEPYPHSPSQVLGVGDVIVAEILWAAISGLLPQLSSAEGGSAAVVSPMEAVRRLLSQPVEIEAETAEELHEKVWGLKQCGTWEEPSLGPSLSWEFNPRQIQHYLN